MKYVHLIRSRSVPSQRYIGVTSNLDQRLRAHNAGHSEHASKYTPQAIAAWLKSPIEVAQKDRQLLRE
jgi:predicted GIY-YIG superfamily endonuclease